MSCKHEWAGEAKDRYCIKYGSKCMRTTIGYFKDNPITMDLNMTQEDMDNVRKHIADNLGSILKKGVKY